ncbi:MAG: phage tail protein, partial [Sphingobium sp.]
AGARRRAADLLQRRMLGRRGIALSRGWAALALQPGDVVALDGHAGGWRIETLEWEGMAVRLGLAGVPVQGAPTPQGADGGSGVRQADRPVGPTHAALVEVPQLSDSPATEPQMVVAACGDTRGWRGAAILLREGADSLVPLGSIRRPAMLGEALSLLPPGPPGLFDMASFVEIRLHDADALPVPASDAALVNGANACMVGEELLQFGHVSQSGPRSYRLSRLLRGRRGTEHRMQDHAVGEAVLLLGGGEGLLALSGGTAMAGRMVGIAAQGIGDAMPVTAQRIADGRAMLPLSPVHVRAEGDAATGLSFRWTRRSRQGWAWLDGTDAPIGEEREAYGVEIWGGKALLRSGTVSAPQWTYAAEAVAADLALAGGGALSFAVRQYGTYGAGPATRRVLSL